MDSIGKIERVLARLEDLRLVPLILGKNLGTSLIIGASTLVFSSWVSDSLSQQEIATVPQIDPKITQPPKKCKPKHKPQTFPRKKHSDEYLRFLTDEDLEPDTDNYYFQSESETTTIDIGQADHNSNAKFSRKSQTRGASVQHNSKYSFMDNEKIDAKADDLYFAIMEELDD